MLSVPKLLSPHATWEYSWIRPPSRSRRRTRLLVTLTGGCARPTGGPCCSARLRDSDATVRQIAQETGYDSEFAFTRAFKRATGSAPGQYRKQAQTTG